MLEKPCGKDQLFGFQGRIWGNLTPCTLTHLHQQTDDLPCAQLLETLREGHVPDLARLDGRVGQAPGAAPIAMPDRHRTHSTPVPEDHVLHDQRFQAKLLRLPETTPDETPVPAKRRTGPTFGASKNRRRSPSSASLAPDSRRKCLRRRPRGFTLKTGLAAPDGTPEMARNPVDL